VDSKIKKLLDQNKIKYETLEHRKVYTAFNAAETQHVDAKQVVKTVYIKLSKTAVLNMGDNIKAADGCLVAVPAGKRVDLKKIAKAINDLQEKTYKLQVKTNLKAKKPAKITAKLANEKDITNKLKTKVGLIAPFGELYNLPVLTDKKLSGIKKLIVSAGSYTESLEIAVKDYVKLINPILGNYTE
jgi:prolyl-tRNA editing enzyme YbaK/EbsC (Cys-tRNA(Pro) deacylase)